MAKAKYKIGNMIRFTSAKTETTAGDIEAIVERSHGYSYLVENCSVEIDESDIVSAYKEMKVRTSSKKRTPRKSKVEAAATEEFVSG